MALLDICTRVMSEVGWPILPAIASSSDATAKQIFAMANTQLRILSEGLNWPQLEVEYDFATVPAQAVYAWPADFRVLAPQSVFNASEYYELKGSLPIQEWHIRKEGLLGNLSRVGYRVTYPLGVPAIEMTPIPTEVENLVATYYSKQFARDMGGVSQEFYVLDTDTSKVPEGIVEAGVKWRFRRAKGLDFSVELAEYDSFVHTQYAKYLASSEIPIGGRRPFSDMAGLTGGYVRDNGFGV